MNKENCVVYSSTDVRKLLGLGRNTLYKFLEKVYHSQKPFKVIKIGNIYKIPKEPFDRWINQFNL